MGPSRWMTLSVEQNLLRGLVAKLNSRKALARLFSEAEIDLSFFGVGVRVKGTQPIVDLTVALERMLRVLEREHKRLLISIDEVVNNAHMYAFASTFQILVRKDLPVFMLMTGLYENIEACRTRRPSPSFIGRPKSGLNLWASALSRQTTPKHSGSTARVSRRERLRAHRHVSPCRRFGSFL